MSATCGLLHLLATLDLAPDHEACTNGGWGTDLTWTVSVDAIRTPAPPPKEQLMITLLQLAGAAYGLYWLVGKMVARHNRTFAPADATVGVMQGWAAPTVDDIEAIDESIQDITTHLQEMAEDTRVECERIQDGTKTGDVIEVERMMVDLEKEAELVIDQLLVQRRRLQWEKERAGKQA